MNGYSNYADYQTAGVWDQWSVTGNRLNITPSYVAHWRDIIEKSRQALWRETPLVVFHDWGFGMPFLDEIPPSEQILWLRVYAPEIFASGAIFAWPLSGGGNLYQPAENVRDTMKSLIRWYSSNRDLFLNTTWVGDALTDLNGQTDIVQTVFDQKSTAGDPSKRIVHLINKRLDNSRNLTARTNFIIHVPAVAKPKSVWAVSPDLSHSQKLDFSWTGSAADITVKTLVAYTVIVLDYKNNGPLDVPVTEVGLPPVEIWPNPASDYIRIRNNPDKALPVQVLDLLGNVILQQVAADDRIDVRGLPDGLYFLRFRDSVVRWVKME
jgi:hypothetical protein